MMTQAMDALVARRWTIEGVANSSISDAGYAMAGVDEGWEGCGKGVNGTQHDDKGNPVINGKFPDMGGLVSHGHARQLKVGWYLNGCACGERTALAQNYAGDVRKLNDLGFDGVKLDDCGAQRNMTLYASLMQATGKSFMIENCHWGRCSPGDESSCPTRDWCPFNWFRTSGDINSSPMSWLGNLQTTLPFQDAKAPLSQPGCWAYPDMLEVGRIQVNGQLDVPWNRAHFGAWCVVSAPLVLGLDLTDSSAVSAVIDIITNREAIAVNQAWSGHPGTRIWGSMSGVLGFPAARPCNKSAPQLRQSGWKLTPQVAHLPGKEEGRGAGAAKAAEAALGAGQMMQLSTPAGGCLSRRGPGYPGGRGGLVVAPCDGGDAQAFTYNESSLQLSNSGDCVDVHSGGPLVWMYGCSSESANDRIRFDADAETASVDEGRGPLCLGVEADDPAGSTFEYTLQAWAKPLPEGQGVALLLLNPNADPQQIELPLYTLPLTGDGKNLTSVPKLAMRDIWARADKPPPLTPDGHSLRVRVGALDSIFVRLHLPSAGAS
jgi:hypothetical protein